MEKASTLTTINVHGIHSDDNGNETVRGREGTKAKRQVPVPKEEEELKRREKIESSVSHLEQRGRKEKRDRDE